VCDSRCEIMGADRFELLKTCVERGFLSVILKDHAVTPDALKKSIKLGSPSFLSKDEDGQADRTS